MAQSWNIILIIIIIIIMYHFNNWTLRLYSHSMRLLELPHLLDLIHQVSSVDVLHDEIQAVLGDGDG